MVPFGDTQHHYALKRTKPTETSSLSVAAASNGEVDAPAIDVRSCFNT
jgi:hypothetical protein